MKSNVISLAVLVVSALSWNFPNADGCSYAADWKPPTTLQKMAQSSELIMANVRRQIRDDKYYRGQGLYGLYNVEVDVLCVLKGSDKSAILNITHAGVHDGMCMDADLPVGGPYIIGIRMWRDDYLPDFVISSENFDEALKACDLNTPTYPTGIFEDTASYKCPAGKPAGECSTD